MDVDYNELFVLNDLSIDREARKKEVRLISGTTWTVDNRGQVYTSRGHQVIPLPNWDGSLRVRPLFMGRQVWRYVNDTVLRAFVGPPPSPKHVPWHRDGDRSNNAVTNLSWVVLSRQAQESDDE